MSARTAPAGRGPDIGGGPGDGGSGGGGGGRVDGARGGKSRRRIRLLRMDASSAFRIWMVVACVIAMRRASAGDGSWTGLAPPGAGGVSPKCSDIRLSSVVVAGGVAVVEVVVMVVAGVVVAVKMADCFLFFSMVELDSCSGRRGERGQAGRGEGPASSPEPRIREK